MQDLAAIATQIRRDIVRMVHGANSGHPGGSLGCADFLTALYFRVMKHNPDFQMDGKEEDVFILSNGHISPVFYSVLSRAGYFPTTELATFRKLNSRLQGPVRQGSKRVKQGHQIPRRHILQNQHQHRHHQPSPQPRPGKSAK